MANKRVKSKKKIGKNINPVHVVLNSVIGALVVVIFLFVYSLYDNHMRIETAQAAYTGKYLEEIPTAILISQEEKKAEVNIILQILNGCGIPGIAAQFQGLLSQKGVDVIDVGNAPSHEYEYSTIYLYGDNLDKAFQLAEMLNIDQSRIFEKEYSSLGNDLTLVLGKDYSHLDKVKIDVEEMKLQILNGCGTNGISKRFQGWFERRGYEVVDVRNADNFKYDRSEILYDNAALTDEINRMKKTLGINDAQIKKVSDLGKANVSIILGKDYAWLNPYSQLRAR